MNNTELLSPRIMITGETGGTGASSTAKILSDRLHVPMISGGKYFRALAYEFDAFQQDHANLATSDQYRAFLEKYQEVFDQKGLQGILKLLKTGIRVGSHEELLTKFGMAIEANQQEIGQIDGIWDYIVDQGTLRDALRSPGFVWESKLAVLAFNLDQLQSVIRGTDVLALPYLKVLFQLDPVVAAQRASEREGKPVTVKGILARMRRDWSRFGNLYQIQGKKVIHSDLARIADVKINTQISQTEVVKSILHSYLRKINTAAQTENVLALPLVNSLGEALAALL